MEEKYYVYEGKAQKKRPAVKLVCPTCGKEFLKAKHLFDADIKRGVTTHYCSKECASKAHETKIEFECAYCGKHFYRKPSSMAKSKSNMYFCCRKCKDSAQKIYTNLESLEKFKKMLPSHYGSGRKNSDSFDYRAYAFALKPHKCERCGYDLNEAALQIHHKDYNHYNNDISNLEIICANCHAIEHWSKK